MKILYWILCGLLNAGSFWCIWSGIKSSAEGKGFLAIPFGAFLAVLPFLLLLISTLMCRYYIGLLGLILPCILVLWGAFVMISPS